MRLFTSVFLFLITAQSFAAAGVPYKGYIPPGPARLPTE